MDGVLPIPPIFLKGLLLEEFGPVAADVFREAGEPLDLRDLMEILDLRNYRRTREVWDGKDQEAKKRLSEHSRELLAAVDMYRAARGL